MKAFTTAVWLLPIVFMLHDFEEILLMKPWLHKNGDVLKKRFPRFAPMIAHQQGLSTAAFALAVAEEFIIISAVTALAYMFSSYAAWFAVLMAFALHLIMHIGQSLMIKGYVPAVATALPAMAYCGWALWLAAGQGLFTIGQGILLTLLGTAAIVINLWLALKLAAWFDRRINRTDKI